MSGGSIIASTSGIALTYDQADRRLTSQTGAGAQEAYTLNAMGLVTEVKIGGVSRSTSSYDVLGRINGYIEKTAAGAVVYERFGFTYNSSGQVLAEKSRQLQGTDWYYSHTTNYYNDTECVTGRSTPGSRNRPPVVEQVWLDVCGRHRPARVSRMRSFRHWKWHLDEIYVKLNGEMVTSGGRSTRKVNPRSYITKTPRQGRRSAVHEEDAEAPRPSRDGHDRWSALLQGRDEGLGKCGQAGGGALGRQQGRECAPLFPETSCG